MDSRSGERGRAAERWLACWDACRQRAPRSRLLASGGILALLCAVTVLRWFVDGAGQAAALLYVVPIALGALRFGRRGGLVVAGFSATAFVVLEAVRAHGDLDVTGWVGPLLAMVLIGGLVGHLSDVAAEGETERRQAARRLEELSAARRSAAEISDSIVQQVAAARWMLESGQHLEALAALDDTVANGIAAVSGTLPPLADGPGHDRRPETDPSVPAVRDRQGRHSA